MPDNDFLPNPLHPTSWRIRTANQRISDVRRVADEHSDRSAQGLLTYGQALRGNPVAHIRQEAIDIIEYLSWVEAIWDDPVSLLEERVATLTGGDLIRLEAVIRHRRDLGPPSG